MFKSKLIALLGLLLIVAVYFLGRKNGSTEVKKTVVNNVELVQEIAELSSLSVTGNTSVKISNLSDKNHWWNRVKNYLAENTLQVAIPYQAKYGVDLNDKKITTQVVDKKIIINLPKCKLLSLQLLLDKLETMNQTGLFSSTTINDLAEAQKQLYDEAITNLSTNDEYISKAQKQIQNILLKYYKPLGIDVECRFIY